MPPFAPFVRLDGSASVYALRGTRWQLAPLQWTFPALRCCGGLNLYCSCSCVCVIIFVSCMLGVLQLSHGSNLYSKNSYLCDSFVSVSLLVVFHIHCT